MVALPALHPPDIPAVSRLSHGYSSPPPLFPRRRESIPTSLSPRRDVPRGHSSHSTVRPTFPQGRPLLTPFPVIPYRPPGDSESRPTCHSKPRPSPPHVIPNLREESRCRVPLPLTLCHPNTPQGILLASTQPTVPIPRRLLHLPPSFTTSPPQQRPIPIPKPNPPHVAASLVVARYIQSFDQPLFP